MNECNQCHIKSADALILMEGIIAKMHTGEDCCSVGVNSGDHETPESENKQGSPLFTLTLLTPNM